MHAVARKTLGLALGVALVISCQLTTARAIPTPTPPPGRPQTTAGAPAASPTGPASQPQAATPSTNAIATAAQALITALEGYQTALSKAQAWSPAAALVEVGAMLDKRTGTLAPLSPEGKSAGWTYTFVDNSKTSPAEKVQAFFVAVSQTGVEDSGPYTYNGLTDLQADPADWTIDSTQAVLNCEQLGGAAFRAANPKAELSASLLLLANPPAAGLAPVAEKNVSWLVQYQTAGGQGESLSFGVDATTGRIYRMDDRNKDFSANQPLTAKAGLDAANSAAHQWNPAATLAVINLDVGSVYAKPDYPKSGQTLLWAYTFVVPQAAGATGPQQALQVVAGSQGMVSFGPPALPKTYTTLGETADWTVDSDAVDKIARANGGQALLDQNPQAVTGMSLSLGFEGTDSQTAKNVRWDVGIFNPDESHDLIDFVIDGATGEVVSKK